MSDVTIKREAELDKARTRLRNKGMSGFLDGKPSHLSSTTVNYEDEMTIARSRLCRRGFDTFLDGKPSRPPEPVVYKVLRLLGCGALTDMHR